ncbi:MAG: MFS transporter [Thermoplasmatota archaeon]
MEYKWKALSVTSVGSFMAAVDGTIVLLALLPIAANFQADFVLTVWVVIAYLLVNTAFVLSFGRVGDMYGRKNMYNLGFVVFTVGSTLSGLAPSAILLILFRAVQGLGAALLTANSFAIISEAFPPEERGKAFGVNAIVWGVGAVLGIILGGIIINFISWRWIFLINLPIGILGTIWARRALHAHGSGQRHDTFDIAGALLFTGGLLALLVGVTWGLLNSWTSTVSEAALLLAPVAFAAFGLWEWRVTRDPIVDFDLFRTRAFAFAVGAAAFQSVATFSVNFLLVFYLEGISGLDILTASYLIVPMAIAIAATGPIAGRVSDRVGSRAVATTGLIIQGMALLALSRLTTTTSLLELGVVEAVFGCGAGMFFPSNTSAIMSASPSKTFGAASGIMNTFRNTGQVLSFAVGLLAATHALPPTIVEKLFVGTLTGKLPPALAGSYLTGESAAFEVGVLFLLVAIGLSVLRGQGVSSPGARRDARPPTTRRPA